MAAEQIANVVISSSPVDNVINLLQTFGFFRVVLPFLLVFAVLYGIILKTGIFGTDDGAHTYVKSISAIVALASAFLVIGYSPVVSALAILMPQASFLLVVALVVLMLLGMFGLIPNANSWIDNGKPAWWAWILAIPIVLIMVGMIGAAVGQNIPVLSDFTNFLIGANAVELSPELMNTLIGLAIVVGIPIIVIALVIWGSKAAGTTTTPRT